MKDWSDAYLVMVHAVELAQSGELIRQAVSAASESPWPEPDPSETVTGERGIVAGRKLVASLALAQAAFLAIGEAPLKSASGLRIATRAMHAERFATFVICWRETVTKGAWKKERTRFRDVFALVSNATARTKCGCPRCDDYLREYDQLHKQLKEEPSPDARSGIDEHAQGAWQELHEPWDARVDEVAASCRKALDELRSESLAGARNALKRALDACCCWPAFAERSVPRSVGLAKGLVEAYRFWAVFFDVLAGGEREKQISTGPEFQKARDDLVREIDAVCNRAWAHPTPPTPPSQRAPRPEPFASADPASADERTSTSSQDAPSGLFAAPELCVEVSEFLSEGAEVASPASVVRDFRRRSAVWCTEHGVAQTHVDAMVSDGLRCLVAAAPGSDVAELCTWIYDCWWRVARMHPDPELVRSALPSAVSELAARRAASLAKWLDEEQPAFSEIVDQIEFETDHELDAIGRLGDRRAFDSALRSELLALGRADAALALPRAPVEADELELEPRALGVDEAEAAFARGALPELRPWSIDADALMAKLAPIRDRVEQVVLVLMKGGQVMACSRLELPSERRVELPPVAAGAYRLYALVEVEDDEGVDLAADYFGTLKSGAAADEEALVRLLAEIQPVLDLEFAKW